MRAPRDRAGWAERLGRELPDPGADARVVAHRSLAHLRGGPGHTHELVSQLVMGEAALVLHEEGDWFLAETADGYVAWIHRHSVVRAGADDPGDLRVELASLRSEGVWVVARRSVVARAGPDEGAPPVADLVEGAVVRAEAPADGALAIVLPDETRGWIGADEAVPAARLAERFAPTGRAILDHTGLFLGLPYLWGGTSEKGFDCSGLVQRIYGLHGVRLPRDSDQQAAAGEPVESSEAWEGVADGDLAFFAETPGGRATHVGILAAGGRILHASTTRHGVAWDALDPRAEGWSDYGRRLAGMLSGIRRVLPG